MISRCTFLSICNTRAVHVADNARPKPFFIVTLLRYAACVGTQRTWVVAARSPEPQRSNGLPSCHASCGAVKTFARKARLAAKAHLGATRDELHCNELVVLRIPHQLAHAEVASAQVLHLQSSSSTKGLALCTPCDIRASRMFQARVWLLKHCMTPCCAIRSALPAWARCEAQRLATAAKLARTN